MARAYALIGDIDRAEQLARTIALADWQARALADVAVITAEAGDSRRAQKLADTISDEDNQARAFVNIALHSDATDARRLIASVLQCTNGP